MVNCNSHLSFSYMLLCTVDYGWYEVATVMFVEITVHIWYRLFNSPYYLNKLRNALNKFIW